MRSSFVSCWLGDWFPGTPWGAGGPGRGRRSWRETRRGAARPRGAGFMDRAAPGSGASSLPLLLALALGKWPRRSRRPRRKVSRRESPGGRTLIRSDIWTRGRTGAVRGGSQNLNNKEPARLRIWQWALGLHLLGLSLGASGSPRAEGIPRAPLGVLPTWARRGALARGTGRACPWGGGGVVSARGAGGEKEILQRGSLEGG